MKMVKSEEEEEEERMKYQELISVT